MKGIGFCLFVQQVLKVKQAGSITYRCGHHTVGLQYDIHIAQVKPSVAQIDNPIPLDDPIDRPHDAVEEEETTR